MAGTDRLAWMASLGLVVGGVVGLAATTAQAQFPFGGPPTHFELSDAVQLDQVDAETKAHLEQVRQFIATSQWTEAIEILTRLLESPGSKVIAVTPRRYVNLRTYCHLQLASLPPEGLALYRDRVDAAAEQLLAGAGGDEVGLRRVVDQYFASRWADDALLALGEIALERGDYGAARGAWEPLVVRPTNPEAALTWLAYPDTNLDRASILARLVLVSIVEDSPERAAMELARFRQEYPRAEGRLGGRTVVLADALAELLAASVDWLPRTSPSDWSTFAGSPTRSRVQPPLGELGQVLWRRPLPPITGGDYGYPSRRIAEDRMMLLSYHPLVVGRLVLVATEHDIRAYDARSGEPAWGDDPVIFRADPPADELSRAGRNALGAQRFTLTAVGHRLLARIGNPVTTSPHDNLLQTQPGTLVCLDLAAEGRVLWQAEPPKGPWAFEGAPLADGGRLYVGLRRGGGWPQAHVQCLDLETGRPLWRQFVCSAETPAQGQIDETTHQLLTLDGDTLYYATHLGAVAALQTLDGRLKWVTLYPRARSGDLTQRATHFFRDLAPAIIDRGRVLVAPADSRLIMALDAPTGMLLWEMTSELNQAHPIHLLGVAGNHLIATGDKVCWLDVETGKAAQMPWPDGPTPKGCGRGLLAGQEILWPTRESIYCLDPWTGGLRRELRLSNHGIPEGRGGNLVLGPEVLVIATGDELLGVALAGPAARRSVTARGGPTTRAPFSGPEGRPAALATRVVFPSWTE